MHSGLRIDKNSAINQEIMDLKPIKIAYQLQKIIIIEQISQWAKNTKIVQILQVTNAQWIKNRQKQCNKRGNYGFETN